ncbi:TetR/AcrR family transcriptional regulator C-terminal domain-containing protein [Phytohabitans kaempferiae]|uniref:TetR/AcrR family transcriptional regulator C-terminal domain-containing protein n=1 Tax=Phytohabitans kaempferiae TaxID=1620943 RepID=A0ABV6M8M2_9ACTN
MSTSTGEPPYRRIAAEIRRRIAAGELRPGDRVPSTRRITQEFDVALATATKALATLRQEGVVEAVPRIGTIVARSAAPPAPPARRPTGGELTAEGVVRTAIRIGDAEGLDAVTVRRVAAELGIPPMSLYRYVPSMEELRTRMVDVLFGEVTLPEPPPGWRAQVELVFRAMWQIFERHRWAARLISFTRPAPSPHGMAYTERVMRPLLEAGLDERTALHAILTLAGHVTITALQVEREAEAVQDTGQTRDDWIQAHDETMTQLVDAGPYPTIGAITDGPDLDAAFELGLALILDGLARRIEAAQAAGRADTAT